jgi:hypothetical protein
MGTIKYKGKLPFKCFNFGRVGHYAKKCPFEGKKNFQKKKILYSKRTTILQTKAMEKKGK